MRLYKQALFFAFFLISPLLLHAETGKRTPAYEAYIDTYGDLAILHQKKYGIPASIKLAQAIMESGGGKSDLARRSNNHFGIKCHGWKGKSVTHDDDLRGECFRKYKTVEDSYDDHSRFLTERPYYTSLFKLKTDDYKGWAKGLQQCGYATDKSYATKLIRIIEEYELYQYDRGRKSNKTLDSRKGGLTSQTPNGKPASLEKIERKRFEHAGLWCIYALEGDSFEQIAYVLNMKEANLRKYNEAPDGFRLEKGAIVYLEKKKKKADKPHYEHIVKAGESMHLISQQYGIRLASLYKLNGRKPDYIPEVGDVLKLR